MIWIIAYIIGAVFWYGGILAFAVRGPTIAKTNPIWFNRLSCLMFGIVWLAMVIPIIFDSRFSIRKYGFKFW